MNAHSRLRTAPLVVMIVGGACASNGSSISLTPATSITMPTAAVTTGPSGAVPLLVVDVAGAGAEISPLILGISADGDADAESLRDAGITLRSWGGAAASRYNFLLGNATNGGVDLGYQNRPWGLQDNAAAASLAAASDAGIVSRLAVPTLGWVASDAEPTTCSFTLPDGACGDAGGTSCLSPGLVADPSVTSVRATASDVASWVGDLVADPRTTPRFIALDNEPELWGVTHYDVHPACSTYEEILLKYIEHASAIRVVAPQAELMGPVMCCWFDYWHTAPGPSDGSDEDFLGWFLRNVRQYDESVGFRTLDVVDVHYYPQADVLNDAVDAETSARRLRSTRSLYDPVYTDESWVSTRIRFLPRIRAIVEAEYPGTSIAVSEWNWGADSTVNGALAIADVLGIYGREGVYVAAYSQRPVAASPGYYAFKMHGNYDGSGGRFTGRTVPVEVEGVDPYDELGAFAALDESARMLRLMLINKQPDGAIDLALDVRSFGLAPTGRVFRYGADQLDAIVEDELPLDEGVSITLPPYSITLVELPAA